MKQVIFTADDFGLTPEVNEAVEQGHAKGVLSCASLMMGAPAVADAVARARRLPSLRVGLHVTVADGQAVLPPAQIPALADAAGNLPRNLALAGVHWFFSPAARRDLAREIRAQFEAFRATGLTLDHVNAHNHMHLHPTVLSIIIRVAREFGRGDKLPPMRLPWEPPAGLLTPWLALLRARLRAAGIRHNDVLAGMAATGHLTAEKVVAALAQMKDGVTEFYFHPAVRSTTDLEAQAPGYDRLGEFEALLSPEVADALRNLGLKPIGFQDLR